MEILGSASIICSDKTGILTHNEMTVERVIVPSGEVRITGSGYDPEELCSPWAPPTLQTISMPPAGPMWIPAGSVPPGGGCPADS